ncbi:TPA: DUF4145 domain-containing protein [Elizabethkingia anophelis]|uniref:DUF4145 domain-containing protein n=1 Tax=Elizabethkingia anophelis TaxID=1117645 RepID=UPI00040C8C96|nr:DUF4145 domain-containing protein [Elizabethkingia anophelis]MCT3746768.1 DUF4145 domain-containing protein [Elizabethkingia anophelis]MDC8028137.1 DUF4145 domain-containing protein [Elizabethkingia anophelis]MDV3493302.1 DUF4145 domain-containing protein [Elizabethkingia anophelis]MDV4132252.1 DUF4145 domain-containing protein [Elizabethkingia anophelis]MDV4136050.1 DUF4145 domain-containing protein [Elizabethkingia anophelis]
MPIIRTIFKNEFTLSNIPDYTCPTCKKSLLNKDENNFNLYESSTSLSLKNHEAWEPDWMYGSFLGLLKCNNISCSEVVIITGNYKSFEYEEYDEISNTPCLDVGNLLTPTFFNPAIQLFQLNENIPEAISEEIKESFKLYWTDSSSCANKVRKVIELIMDNLKIPKTHLKSKKRVRYSLHQRIENFKIKNHNQGELLMAIKWIGNSGSHSSDKISHDDLLDSYEILELLTEKLYGKHLQHIEKISKDINKKKKPLSQTKIKINQ